MSSITKHLRLAGVTSVSYQERQSLSMEQALAHLDQMSMQFSTEQYNYTEEGIIDSIWSGIKAFFKTIGDFFAGLFGKSKEKEVERILADAKKELDALADASREANSERVSSETERLVKDTNSALSVNGLKLQDVPSDNQADFDKFMLSEADWSHTRDQSLSDEERIKKTREALSVIAQNANALVRTAEEKAGKAVLNKVAQTLPRSATPSEVASVASKTLAVTEAKMKLVSQDQGRCNLPGIDYEGSKLHIALANYKILSEKIVDATTLQRGAEIYVDMIKDKQYHELAELDKETPILADGRVHHIVWDKEDKKYYYIGADGSLNTANHAHAIIASATLGATDYAGIVANISKNNDTKSVGNLIKSIRDEIDQSSKTITVFSKVAEKIVDATASVDKIDPKTASKVEAEAVRYAGTCLREIGRLCAVSEQLQRTALANALQAVRILRRKAGQMKEYNGLLNKLNAEVAKVKSRK